MKTFSVFGDVCNQTITEGIKISEFKRSIPCVQLGGGIDPKKIVFIGYKDFSLLVAKNKRIYFGEVIYRMGKNIIIFPKEFTDDKVLVLWRVIGELNGHIDLVIDKNTKIISGAKFKKVSKDGKYFVYRQDVLIELRKHQQLVCKRTPGCFPDKIQSRINVLRYDGDKIITKYIK